MIKLILLNRERQALIQQQKAREAELQRQQAEAQKAREAELQRQQAEAQKVREAELQRQQADAQKQQANVQQKRREELYRKLESSAITIQKYIRGWRDRREVIGRIVEKLLELRESEAKKVKEIEEQRKALHHAESQKQNMQASKAPDVPEPEKLSPLKASSVLTSPRPGHPALVPQLSTSSVERTESDRDRIKSIRLPTGLVGLLKKTNEELDKYEPPLTDTRHIPPAGFEGSVLSPRLTDRPVQEEVSSPRGLLSPRTAQKKNLPNSRHLQLRQTTHHNPKPKIRK
jgi:DNA repair exonuclease SbcCD ATPase subunit